MDNNVDLLLIYPYLEDANWKNELRSKDNLALGYLASSARRKNYTVKIIHAEHNKYSSKDIQDLVLEYNPRVIGISLTAQRAYMVVKEYVKKIKEVLNIPIFLGGIFPTAAYDLILKDCKYIDAICLGEGENFVVDYLDAVIRNKYHYTEIKGIAYLNKDDEVITNGDKLVIEDLDSLPYPAKDFFEDMKEEIKSGFYYVHISAGRGCYGNCSFCSMKTLTGEKRRRVRNPKDVVFEMKTFQKLYGVNCFYFVDELFIDKNNLKWIYDFCDEIEKQKVKVLFHAEARVDSITRPIIKALKKAGLDNLFIGFESGSLAMLNKYRKGHTPDQAKEALKILNEFDVTLEYGYIMIDPNLTFEKLKENILWILNLGNYTKHNLYNKLNLYYGTDLYKEITNSIETEIPFYERKFSKFKDDKVSRFSYIIDYVKEAFSEYNSRVNEYILSKVKMYETNNCWQVIADDICKFEVSIWKKIILFALNEAEKTDIDMKVLEDSISINIEKLNHNLNEVMKKDYTEDSFSKRFKPL